MSIQGIPKQHVVEFIPGVGMVMDGVVDATSLNGPWTWTPPDGVVEGMLDGCGGGGSGSYCGTTGVSRAGGGGGSSGFSVTNFQLDFLPGSLLTITVGAGGAVPAVGAGGGNGGYSVISGLSPRQASALFCYTTGVADNQIVLHGGKGAQSSGAGGQQDNYGSGGSVGVSGASPTAGGQGVTVDGLYTSFGAAFFMMGCGGGGANSIGSTTGSAGARWTGSSKLSAIQYGFMSANAGGTDGTNSYGGGGDGGASLFGLCGQGGVYNVNSGNAGAALGYGAGGGGSSGYATGYGVPTAGTPGYMRITYWSAH